jgi:hypothetical protein
MAKANWDILGAGSYAMVSDTPSGSGLAIRLDGDLTFLYNGKTNITAAEVVWWQKLYPSGSNRVFIRNQGLADVNNCYAVVTNSAGNVIALYKRVAGTWTLLASTSGGTLITWTKFRIRVKAWDFLVERWSGSAWVFALAYNDGAHTFANGVSGFGYAAGNNYFDDVLIGEEL